ncbi:MAG: TetR/AcrR family transcriptional regulator [Acidimicrobiales bacterium]
MATGTDLVPAPSGDGPGTAAVASGDAGDDGERVETKGERTRRRLLEIAIDKFGERGYRATSVSEIAREAGLTQAAAYAYFSSKENLFDAAVDADAAATIDRVRAMVAEVPATQLVPMLLVFLLGGVDDHALLKRVLQGLEPEALHRLVNLPALTDLAHLIEHKVRDAQARGEVRDDLDAEQFANGAEAIIVSLLLSVTQVEGSTEARRQLGVLSIFDTVLRPPA